MTIKIITNVLSVYLLPGAKLQPLPSLSHFILTTALWTVTVSHFIDQESKA